VLLFLFLKSFAQNPAQVRDTCASNPYVISEAIDSFFDISANTCLFVDKTTQLALEAVLKKDQDTDFTPLSLYHWEGRFQRGRYAYWLRFSIQNKTRDTLSLAFYSGQKDSMLLYELSDVPPAAIFTGRAASNFYAWEDLRFPNKYLFSLKLSPGQTHHYLLRLRTIPSFHEDVVPRLYDQAYLFQKSTTNLLTYYLIHGIFLGFLLFAFLFSLAQFIETRGLAFLYFSCYVLAAILIYYRTLQNDEPFFVFNSIFSGFYQHTYYGPLTWLAYIFHLLFVDKLLNTKETSPQLHRFIRFAIYSMIGLFLIDRIVFMFDVWLSWQILTLARIAFFLASLYILFLVWKKKDQLYRYVLTGDSLLIVSVISTILLSNTPTHLVNSPWNYADIPSYFGAFLQILCFILGLAYTSRRTEVQKIRIEEELLRQQKEAFHLQEIDAFKTRFYTNITHEFRTPLTVIGGMVEQINKNPGKWLEEGLEMIRRNSRNLLNLVNQMLSLSKLESGHLQVHLIYGDVLLYLNYLCESFHSFADSKNITLHFESELKTYWMDYDAGKLEQIVSNLVSNAIIYSPPGGTINVGVRLQEQDTQLEIRVQDTGVGIAAEALPHIFDRFYQTPLPFSHPEAEVGTGIGLALTKELVNLLEGNIQVTSTMGLGSEFKVLLPVTHQFASMPLKTLPGGSQEDGIPAVQQKGQSTAPSPKASEHLLLIEDNPDVVRYLTACLEDCYHLHIAPDGAAGLEQALSLIPDLIVSDVMMPRMNGFELCDALKKDERSSHIPIILLTAKGDMDSRLEGLQKGADAYLIKPFQKEELLIRIQNLLALRRSLQAHYFALATRDTSEAPAPAEENAFVLKVRAIVEAHLDDHHLDVVRLCREVGMSNSALHRKLTALTGHSANHFIRRIRLSKACTMLHDPEQTIAVVAYECGFNDPVYFARVFKQEFGLTPSEWRSGHGV